MAADIGPDQDEKAARVGRLFSFCCRVVSALTGLVPALGLVDHIDPALAAHDTAIAVTLLERAERVLDLHGLSPSSRRGDAPKVSFWSLRTGSWWAVLGSNQ
jgi:hypothetical protein